MLICKDDDMFVALEFETDEGLDYCIELLAGEEFKNVQYALPGRQSVVLQCSNAESLAERIKKRRHVFSVVPVAHSYEVPRERLAQLRAQRGRPTEQRYGDIEWKKERIKQLKKEVGQM